MSQPEAESCCVLRTTDERVDVSEVARLVAGTVKRPRFEVARELRMSHGIIARDVPEAAARQILQGLQELGVAARVIPERDVVDLPEPERVKQVVLGPKGVFFGLGETRLTATWAETALVLAVRLGGQVERVIRRARDDAYTLAGPYGAYGARGNIANVFDWTSTREVSHTVIDFYRRQPWRRLRVEEGLVDFALDHDADRPSTTNQLVTVGRQLLQWGGSVYLSPGVRLLAEHGSELAWRDLTFADERHLDAYSLWQVQVALLR